MTVHATTEDQKDQRYMLPASPHEKVPSLLDKAVKRFNRTLGRDQAEVDKYILKVCTCMCYSIYIIIVHVTRLMKAR